MAFKFGSVSGAPAGGDWEDESINRQLQFADELRKSAISNDVGKMVGRHYVRKSPWINAVEGFVSGYQDAQGQARRAELGQSREAQMSDWLRRRPSSTMEQSVPGTPAVTQEFPGADAFGGEGSAPVTAEVAPAVAPSTRMVAKPVEQLASETSDWGLQAPTHTPMGQAVLARTLGGIVDAPMRAAEHAAKVKEAEAKALAEAGLISHYETSPTGEVTGFTKNGQRINLGSGGKVQAPVVHYETDDAGNTTAIIRDATGKITKETVGQVGKTKTQAAAATQDPVENALIATAINEGRLDPTKVNSRNRAIIAATLQQNPKADLNDLAGVSGSNRATEMEFSAKGISGRSVRAINTAVDHLETLKGLGEALKNGNVQAFNAVGNEVAKQFGYNAPTDFDSVKQIVAAEVVKSVVPGGGGVTERMELADKIKASSSPAQMLGFIDAAQKLMGGQMRSLEQSYTKGDDTRKERFRTMLLPRTLAAINKSEGGGGGAAPTVVRTGTRNGKRVEQLSDGTIREAQ